MSGRDEPGPTHTLFLAKDWGDVAEENVERWGNQAVATLFLALVEEVGEVAEVLERRDMPNDMATKDVMEARALIEDMASLGIRTRDYLEENFEEPAGESSTPKSESVRREQRRGILGDISDPDAVQDEVDDAAPLLFQLTWALQDERDRE